MAKLKDSQLAANVRERTREGVRKMRERQVAAGNLMLSVWVSRDAKDRLEVFARMNRITLGEAATVALERLDLAATEGAAPP